MTVLTREPVSESCATEVCYVHTTDVSLGPHLKLAFERERDGERHEEDSLIEGDDAVTSFPCPPLPPKPPPSQPSDDVRAHASHAARGKTERRRKQRLRSKHSRVFLMPKLRSSLSQMHRLPPAIKNGASATNFRAAQGSWVSLQYKVNAQVKDLQELLAEGLELVRWNGVTPKALTDREGRIIAVLAGRPVDDPTWERCLEGMQAEMDMAGSCITQGQAIRKRRGNFKAVNTGISFGQGHKKPSNLKQATVSNAKAVEKLLSNQDVRRVAGFGSSALSWYAPKLFKEYVDMRNSLLSHQTELQPPFENSVYTAAVFNFGPQVVTYEHVDSANKPNGWCAITSLGNFDSSRGGHIILRTLGLVVEFPPGSTVLIPSGTVVHGNATISEHEKRSSFTQYTAGALFRWVRYGFRLEDDLDPKLAAEIKAERSGSWERALDSFSYYFELHEDRANIFGAFPS